MKKYKCISADGSIPVGTILTLEQMDVGYEHLIPYWAYSYSFKDARGCWCFGELERRYVEERPSYYELIEENTN